MEPSVSPPTVLLFSLILPSVSPPPAFGRPARDETRPCHREAPTGAAAISPPVNARRLGLLRCARNDRAGSLAPRFSLAIKRTLTWQARKFVRRSPSCVSSGRIGPGKRKMAPSLMRPSPHALPPAQTCMRRNVASSGERCQPLSGYPAGRSIHKPRRTPSSALSRRLWHACFRGLFVARPPRLRPPPR
jgi:hypothetical protein